MRTFRAYFRKEILESARQSRYIILAAVFLFFAIVDPLILKLLPHILKGQLPVDITRLIKVTKAYAVNNYVKDVFQIINLVIALTLMGTISEEVTSKSLVFPCTKGASAAGIVAAKVVHYVLTVCILAILGFSVNYYYADMLFSEGEVSFSLVFTISLLICVYLIFNISLLIFFSSLFKKPILAGILMLVVTYAMSIFSGTEFGRYLPYYFIELSGKMTSGVSDTSGIVICVVCTFVYSVILNMGAVLRLKVQGAKIK